MSRADSSALQMCTTWGARRIDYRLQLEQRRDLLIAVHPDLRVNIRAPEHKPIEQVMKRINARRSWIASRLGEFERFTPLPPPRFISGETIYYLGRGYRLRVERRGRGVLLHSGRLFIRVPHGAGQRAIGRAVDAWFRNRAASVVRARLDRLVTKTGLFGGLQPNLRIRAMSRRWGSCTAKGTISINPALLQAPPPCVDYVIVHELVHLLEASHSRRFYALLDRAMPDWRQRRERLARAAVRWP